MRFLFILALVLFSGSFSFAEGTCNVSIQCTTGEAACTGLAARGAIHSECGISAGKARSCHTTVYDEVEKKSYQKSTFICCKSSGTAFVTSSETDAAKECADAGTAL